MRLQPSSSPGVPQSGDRLTGEFYVDSAGDLYFCKTGGGTAWPRNGSSSPRDVSSQTLMGHSYRVIRRMRYGTDSTRERHNDRAAVFRVKCLEGATACDP
jgi:hypothetical protein